MRNTWLIIRREYLERVRTKAFIIFTLLMPLFMYGIIFLPAKLMSLKSGAKRNITVVATSPEIADAIKQRLENPETRDRNATKSDDSEPVPTYVVTTKIGGGDEEERKKLSEEVSSGRIDGFVWVTDQELARGKFVYTTKHASDFIDISAVRDSVNNALMRTRMVAKGIPAAQVTEVLQRLEMDTIGIDKSGKESKGGGIGAFLLPFMLMFMIYMTVLIYGVAVMRSVLEEKTSRVVEVMLSSATATQMMAGKILGVGAVGFTQILIWIMSALVVSTPGLLAASSYLKNIQLAPAVFIFFPVFFALGYLLYSTMYAAVGAMVNSDEEAQQMQWPVLLPLIMCSVFASAVIRDPNSPLAFWTSLFPLTSPVIMFVRITVQQPPMWQILLAIALAVATEFGLIWLCSRIYRVGILMYGKRPTLPEIMKWIKYA